MNNNRRKFLTSSTALTASALATNLGTWGVESANAQAASGYKAVVCVFLFGGNDANNMIVPITDYTAYQTVRTVASAVGIPQGNLLPFAPPSAGKSYGFHPSMASVAPLFGAGKLAVIANSGTLLRPLTKATYAANRPPNLFSHSDQTDQWQGLLQGTPSRSGWGGRMADELVAANTGQLIPSAVSVVGSQIFTSGNVTAPLVVPQNNIVTVSGQGNGTNAVDNARYAALNALLKSADPSSTVVSGAANVFSRALLANATANPLLQMTSPAITGAFPTAVTNTGIGQQLRQVARLIDGRAATGVKRQFFFVGVGGYDTHSNTVTNQTNLFNALFPAMRAFYDYTVAAGVANDVVQVTMSDFNRTFIGNANQGVDHAWGGHQLVIGGGVKGGDMYGSFTDLVVGGAQDSGRNGSWIPGISVDQVGATLGSWLGMPGSDIDQVFPNLANFSTRNLGFML